MQIIWLIVESILLGGICAIPGLIVSKYLVQNGFLRPGNTNHIIILGGSILGLLTMRIFVPQIPVWADMITISLAGPSGAFRNDLWLSSQRGRWWWTKNKKTS